MGRGGHDKGNFLLCLLATYVLFLFGSATGLAILQTISSGDFLSRGRDRGLVILRMSGSLTLFVPIIAIPAGYIQMYVFGGLVSTRAMRAYLFITRGKHVVPPKTPETKHTYTLANRLELRRQITYWVLILAVVVSFATYLARHRIPLVVTPSGLSEVSTVVTSDFVTLTLSAALIVPVIALALPYIGGLKLRSIDVGPFHSTVLSLAVGISGGFSLLYALFTKPLFQYMMFYVFLFMGACWCFALGCNLAVDSVNRRIIQQVLSPRPNARLLASRIWLETPERKLFEA